MTSFSILIMIIDSISCQQCLLPLDCKLRIPRISPQCGHTVCSKCINRKLGENYGVFVCKIDKKIFKASGIQDFPKNQSMITLISSLSSQEPEILSPKQSQDSEKAFERMKNRVLSSVNDSQKVIFDELDQKLKAEIDQVYQERRKLVSDINEFFYQLFQMARHKLQIPLLSKENPKSALRQIKDLETSTLNLVKKVVENAKEKIKQHTFLELTSVRISTHSSLKKSNQPKTDLSVSRCSQRQRVISYRSSKEEKLDKSELKKSFMESKEKSKNQAQKQSYQNKAKMERISKFVETVQGGILQLTNLGIKDQDVKEIFNLISDSGKKVSTLKLVKNELTDVGFRVISQKLKSNTVIHTLNLTWNHLTQKSIDLLQQLLERNSCLKNIYFSNNGISKAANKRRKEQIESSRGVNLFI